MSLTVHEWGPWLSYSPGDSSLFLWRAARKFCCRNKWMNYSMWLRRTELRFKDKSVKLCDKRSQLLLLFSGQVMSDSLQPHELQHARLPCPSPSPWVCSNSCSLSQWCHPTILSSVTPFSSCPQSFPASGSFPISWLFASGGQSIGASASVLPMNIQGWFSLGLTGLISLLSKELLRVLQQHSLKTSSLWCSAFFMVQLSRPYMASGKIIALTIGTFVSKVMSLLLNTTRKQESLTKSYLHRLQ